jgi:hypothetical protein
MNWEDVMRIINKFACGIAVAALFAANFTGTEAKTKPRHRQYVHKRFGHLPPDRSGVRRSADGDLIDRNGWRLRNGQWDNTCFNLGYLSSQSACGNYSGGGAPQ